MASMTRRVTAPRRSFALGLFALGLAAWLTLGLSLTAQAASPFDALLGSWRGSGQIQLTDGRRERLTCNAYYTGGGSQLGMAILCQSESSNVQIRSKLSESGGRISGSWEERTFNARGTASGQVRPGMVSLRIGGGVTGSMTVSYTRSRQSVSISTQGVGLKSVTITLNRS